MSGPGGNVTEVGGAESESAGDREADSGNVASVEVPPRLLRVVRGDPTPAQLAALVAVVAARRATAALAEPPPVRRTGWSARERTLRGVPRPGPGQWRATAV